MAGSARLTKNTKNRLNPFRLFAFSPFLPKVTAPARGKTGTGPRPQEQLVDRHQVLPHRRRLARLPAGPRRPRGPGAHPPPAAGAPGPAPAAPRRPGGRPPRLGTAGALHPQRLVVRAVPGTVAQRSPGPRPGAPGPVASGPGGRPAAVGPHPGVGLGPGFGRGPHYPLPLLIGGRGRPPYRFSATVAASEDDSPAHNLAPPGDPHLCRPAAAGGLVEPRGTPGLPHGRPPGGQDHLTPPGAGCGPGNPGAHGRTLAQGGQPPHPGGPPPGAGRP